MARRDQSSFQRTLDEDETTNLQERHGGYKVALVLQIRAFLRDDNGNVVGELLEDGFWEVTVLPESQFGSSRHRKHVARRLREAGCRKRRRVRRMLAAFFSDTKLALERKKEKISESDGLPPVILCVKKFVKWEDYLEAMALQSPAPVPATKESIQALQNLNNLEDYRLDSNEDCMICLEKLASGTDQVTRMPCSHLFHGDCIKKWLNTCHQCPLCRFPMPTDNATP